jgi:hypothetical protein
MLSCSLAYETFNIFFLSDNLVEDLLSDFEYELQPPYLLYRNAAQEVNGIWFYNQQDCDAVANLFGRYGLYVSCSFFSRKRKGPLHFISLKRKSFVYNPPVLPSDAFFYWLGCV